MELRVCGELNDLPLSNHYIDESSRVTVILSSGALPTNTQSRIYSFTCSVIATDPPKYLYH